VREDQLNPEVWREYERVTESECSDPIKCVHLEKEYVEGKGVLH
jgi:hypothetical protein